MFWNLSLQQRRIFIFLPLFVLRFDTCILRSYFLSDLPGLGSSIRDGLTFPSSIIPLRTSDTSKVTISTSVFVERQWGRMYAFLCFVYNSFSWAGLGSTSSPVQSYFISKNKVLDRYSPSTAPASIKNPFVSFWVLLSPNVKVSIQGFVKLWGDCRNIPSNQELH